VTINPALALSATTTRAASDVGPGSGLTRSVTFVTSTQVTFSVSGSQDSASTAAVAGVEEKDKADVKKPAKEAAADDDFDIFFEETRRPAIAPEEPVVMPAVQAPTGESPADAAAVPAFASVDRVLADWVAPLPNGDNGLDEPGVLPAWLASAPDGPDALTACAALPVTLLGLSQLPPDSGRRRRNDGRLVPGTRY
jgi:hypothetical protein